MSFDVLIVGTGLAGLYAALLLQDLYRCLLLTKDSPQSCNSFYAQGGIAVARDEADVAVHIQDTLGAGAGLCDEEAVELLCQKGHRIITRLIEDGLPFDRNEQGDLLYTREGAHTRERILHCQGDATGRVMHGYLLERIKAQVMTRTIVTDLLMQDGVCYGVCAVQEGKEVILHARHVILASGGLGSLFAMHTNDPTISGDLHGIALEKGLELRDMEMLQFHPTVFVQNPWARKCLLSEALRGEGAWIINEEGKRFVIEYDPRGELAPRDILSRAIFERMNRFGERVFLSFAPFQKEFLRARFPNIHANLESFGFSLPEDPVPISPAFHYAMGGIKTDLWGRVPKTRNLYAIGECANTRVHGANRLASNSLLEALVFAAQAAESILGDAFSPTGVPPACIPYTLECSGDTALKERLRKVMWERVGIIRTPKGLRKALDEVEEMLKQEAGRMLYLRLRTARSIIQAALARKKSLGAHTIT